MTNCLNTYSKYPDIALADRQILTKSGQDLHVVKIPNEREKEERDFWEPQLQLHLGGERQQAHATGGISMHVVHFRVCGSFW